MTVIDKLKELGYTTIPKEFYTYVSLWKSWYVGKVNGFHQYRRYNGHKWTKCNRASLGMAKKVCEDWANLLMNEKVQITLEGQKEQEFIDRVLTANNFTVKANEMQEMKSALGTVAYIPRVVGQAVNESGEIVPGDVSGIELDYVTIEHIFPLVWQNGFITECAFDSVVTRAGKNYLYLQIHRKDENGLYVIDNSIYRYENETLADARLTDVPGFERIPLWYIREATRGSSLSTGQTLQTTLTICFRSVFLCTQTRLMFCAALTVPMTATSTSSKTAR